MLGLVLSVLYVTTFASTNGQFQEQQNAEEGSKQWLHSWAVTIDHNQMTKQTLEQLAAKHGLEVIGNIGGFNDSFFLHPITRECGGQHCRGRRNVVVDDNLMGESGILDVVQQHELRRSRHASLPESANQDVQTKEISRARRWSTPRDPLWSKQWYFDDSQSHHHNVMQAWKENITGNGVVVCAVDDGIEHDHDDLKRNYDPDASWDYNDNDNDAFPRVEDPINNHGTRCCGVIAAEYNNDACGVGTAYNAKVGGIRMLDGPVSDVVESNSLGHHPQHIDIYSSSWGPNDDGRTMEAPGRLTSAVLKEGVEAGRGGKGSIFLFASGNGGSRDDCNCDGYANSLYTMAVSALTERDSSPYYAENCAAAMTTTYSSGGGRSITTVDIHGRCTSGFSGTSAASPLAAGVLALVLETNGELTWRDMQHIVVHSSDHVNPSDSSWTKTSTGLYHSHQFGFGRLNAGKAVELAKTWTHVPPQITTTMPTQNGGVGKSETFELKVQTSDTDITKLEHVQLKVNAKGASGGRGKLNFMLYCPDGTVSVLLSGRSSDRSTNIPSDWTFMTVRCWDQSPVGAWKLMMRSDNDATLDNWQLILHGTASSDHTKDSVTIKPDPTRPPTHTQTQAPVSSSPSPTPTQAPDTSSPTTQPSPAPTSHPRDAPSRSPQDSPVTEAPSPKPSGAPSFSNPTLSPTHIPSTAPRLSPTTQSPTPGPTFVDTTEPVPEPVSPKPTPSPSGEPTPERIQPTEEPTLPTEEPTPALSTEPMAKPGSSTPVPSIEPTPVPTSRPFPIPTRLPTARVHVATPAATDEIVANEKDYFASTTSAPTNVSSIEAMLPSGVSVNTAIGIAVGFVLTFVIVGGVVVRKLCFSGPSYKRVVDKHSTLLHDDSESDDLSDDFEDWIDKLDAQNHQGLPYEFSDVDEEGV